MSEPTLSVPLRFVARETPVRRGEPVTVGLPWPKGAVRDDRQFRLIGPDGSPQVLQAAVLDRWPDGSVRWCLFDFLATVGGGTTGTGSRSAGTPTGRPTGGLRATPIVVAEGFNQFLGVAMPDFWENFPKAVHTGGGRLALDLFPGET